MTLREIQNTFINEARGLGNYEELTKNELVNGYCDAEEAGDEIKRSQYYAALLLRYWYKIFNWERECKSLNIEITDYVDWLDDCMRDALYYRSWRPLRQITKDSNGCFTGPYLPNPQYQAEDINAADKSINYFCSAKRGKMYQALNKDKRKANTQTMSLDSSVDENGDCALNYAGAYVNAKPLNGIFYLVKKLVDKGQSIEALIIDSIANYDSLKETKITKVAIEKDYEGNDVSVKYNNYSHAFDAKKVVKHLNNLNQEFLNSFNQEYEVNLKNDLLNTLEGLTNAKLYKYIDKTLCQLKSNKDLLSYLSL